MPPAHKIGLGLAYSYNLLASPIRASLRAFKHFTKHPLVLFLDVRMMPVDVRTWLNPADHFGWIACHHGVLFHVLHLQLVC